MAFLTCALPIGFGSGLLKIHPAQGNPGRLVALAAYLFLSPALVEEVAFRALLLPREWSAMPRHRLLAVCAGALALFVGSHVINGLFFRHGAREIFTNPWFLLLAGLMGATCIATYLTSRSVWPGVAAHWLTVTTWILLLGGQRLVGIPPG